MLTAAIVLLTGAVLAGAGLALWHLYSAPAPRVPLAVGVGHGLTGAAGFAALLLTPHVPPHGRVTGAEGFDRVAFWLFAGALATGILIFLWRRRGASVTIAIHAGLAICAYVLFVAWVSLV